MESRCTPGWLKCNTLQRCLKRVDQWFSGGGALRFALIFGLGTIQVLHTQQRGGGGCGHAYWECTWGRAFSALCMHFCLRTIYELVGTLNTHLFVPYFTPSLHLNVLYHEYPVWLIEVKFSALVRTSCMKEVAHVMTSHPLRMPYRGRRGSTVYPMRTKGEGVKISQNFAYLCNTWMTP